MSDLDNLLTPADLAERLRITEAKVMELRRLHDWPHVRLGRRFRFTVAQVEQIIASQSVKGGSKSASSKGQTARSLGRAS